MGKIKFKVREPEKEKELLEKINSKFNTKIKEKDDSLPEISQNDFEPLEDALFDNDENMGYAFAYPDNENEEYVPDDINSEKIVSLIDGITKEISTNLNNIKESSNSTYDFLNKLNEESKNTLDIVKENKDYDTIKNVVDNVKNEFIEESFFKTPIKEIIVDSYDMVNHPKHYTSYEYETIDMMRKIYGDEKTAIFCELNAFKYRMRMGTKPGNSFEQDFKKEQWYLKKKQELIK